MKRALTLAIISIVMSTPVLAQRRLSPVDDWFAGGTSAGQGGGVTVRVTVAPDGSVTRCDVTFSTASAVVQRRTCEIVRAQARYSRGGSSRQDMFAVNWAGNPLAAAISLDYGGAVLVLSQGLVSDADYNSDVARIGEGRVGLRFAIGADGRVGACRATSTSGSAAVDAYTCRLVSVRARFRMPVDEAGAPFATEGRLTVVWRRPAL